MLRQAVSALLFTGLLLSDSAQAGNPAPRNPFLAHSSNPIGHTNSAQQDSVPQAGPAGPSRTLKTSELEYRHTGPFQFGTTISGVYPDGKRVLWSNGANGVFKADHDSFEIIDNYFASEDQGGRRYTEKEADAAIEEFNTRQGVSALYFAFKQSDMFKDLSGVYTLLDNNHEYYIGEQGGKGITVYGDEDPADSRSKIIEKRQWKIPAGVTGKMIGMNLTFDGWIVFGTEHGYVVAVKRDFSEHRVSRLNFAEQEDAENAATGPTGKGWVRNGQAVDESGIYIASQNHMHKVVWKNQQLSVAEKDGAWSVRYGNTSGHGTGATPSLMGFGDEDRFVVITDGDTKMNLVLYWRDAIPSDWEQLPGSYSRRVAGVLPVDMGNPDLDVQSEQSVVVSGYGAALVNNMANRPWYVPARAGALLNGFLGSREEYKPFGIQKFAWNPDKQRLENAWVNTRISSPNAMPLVSAGSDILYTTGVRSGQWTLEGIDWSTGKSKFHYVLGDERYNSLYAGVLLDENGNLFFGTTFGKVRLKVSQ
ncbi:MAG: hypothetical protein ACR2PT_21030 [Endozoicomonas sp.]